ncbi:MAG: PD40 domain-containing protein, partial [Anaerolineae bacterium]|nr:PD40 domain-containing protein [Anaerolineae bacterium]
ASPRVIAQDDEHFFIYIHWSPVPCPDRPECRQLAYLIEKEAGQIGLHLVDIEGERINNRLLDQGRPFYFGWMPDGQQMLWHTGGSSRFNPDARLALYDIKRDVIEALPHSPASFLAPASSPQGNRWLATMADEAEDTLQIVGPDSPLAVTQTNVGHQIAFGWSPNGQQVAYAAVRNLTDPFYGPIHIFDVETGEAQQLTGNTFCVSGFFWSPDGQKIAYLHKVGCDKPWLQWRVIDLTTGVERGYNVFTPSYQMRYVIASFDQYAQSHRFWSPDGRYLVYGDQDEDRVERVYLVDTVAERGTLPIFIDEGTMGFWSWN